MRAQNAPPRLHVIDPSEALQRALAIALEESETSFQVGTVSTQWLAMHDWDYEPSAVVVRAAIRDVWPVLLKVRALQALHCRAVVLLDQARYERAGRRLLAAGAFSLVDTAQGLPALTIAATEALADVAAGRPAALRHEPAPMLADRSLQVAALYTSAQAPTTPQVGRALGISAETVRTHLERARRPYRDQGIDVSSRAALRAALDDDGQIVGESGWFE